MLQYKRESNEKNNNTNDVLDSAELVSVAGYSSDENITKLPTNYASKDSTQKGPDKQSVGDGSWVTALTTGAGSVGPGGPGGNGIGG